MTSAAVPASVVIQNRNDEGAATSSQACTPSERRGSRDKTSAQQYVHYHRQSSLCLPSTQEGMHPALVLVKQKGLVCANVCEERRNTTDRVLRDVDAMDDDLYAAMAVCDLNHDGRIDQSELGNLIKAVCQQIHTLNISEQEVDVLTHFVPVDKDCLVAQSRGDILMAKLKMALVLWSLVCEFRKAWSKVVEMTMTKVQILEGLKDINNGCKVDMREAHWIKEKFLSIHSSTDALHVDETKFMLCLAYWYSAQQDRAKKGLNRSQLILRIELERRLRNGCWRFILWAGVYVLLSVSLIGSGNLASCRGIRGNLESQLNLQAIQQVTTIVDVENYTKEFSRVSAKFSPLSRVYFGVGNAWMLQDASRKFEEPVPLSPLLEPDPNEDGVQATPLSIGKSFTLQAWVQFDAGMPLPAGGVSLLRKAMGNTGQDSVHSCWDWRFPPALSYGAHDYGSAQGNGINELMEEHIQGNYPTTSRNETIRSVLHTLLVSPTKVIFMVDDRVLDEQPLRRPVTDCQRTDITMGDRGLTLAAVRFYPKELTAAEVREIFTAGSRMVDIGYIISPPRAKAMDSVAALSLGVEQKIESLEMHSLEIEEASWVSSVITGEILKGDTEHEIYVNADHPVNYRSSDPVLGHPYWEVYSEPVSTDKTSKNLANGTLLPAVPVGGGFTISSWLKFDSETGSGFFMALSMPVFDPAQAEPTPVWNGWDNLCWFIFMGGGYTGFYTRSAASEGSGPSYFVDDLTGEDRWKFTGLSYRHIVFQMDPRDPQRPLRVCIDGVCTGHEAIDLHTREYDNTSWPPAADCRQTALVKNYAREDYREQAIEQSRLYLNRRPPHMFPLTANQMSTKYFDRLLTEAEIQNIFDNDPDPDDPGELPIRQTRGCVKQMPQDDPLWKDEYGHDCYWYFQNRLTREEICIGTAVRKACPMACRTSETCWGTKQEDVAYQIWTQQMDFETSGPSGTMCVASSTTPEKEAIKCGLNAPNFPQCEEKKAEGKALECGPKDCSAFEFDRENLIKCLNNTRWVPESGTRLDFFVACKDIVELSRPECSWDDSGLDSMAASIRQNEAWSVSFWFESMTTESCSQPQVRLLGGDGGTFAWLGPMDGMVDDVAAGPGWLPGCSPERWLSFGLMGTLESGLLGSNTAGDRSADLQAARAKPGKKHFVVMGRLSDGSVSLHYNEVSNEESATANGVRPLSGDRSFLRVINVGGNVRMSPMLLRPYFPDAGLIGRLRFEQQVDQDRRVGPSRPLHQQLNERLVRSPRRFSQKTMMISPPLVLQVRNKRGECKSEFSNEIVEKVQQHVALSQCNDPYECPMYTVDDVSTCPHDETDETEHFGHYPVHFRGETEKHHMEFLFSIAENAVLVRNEMVDGERKLAFRNTNEYFDLLTNNIKILALFYSVEFGITSMLTINFETSEGRVTATHRIQHYVAMMDDQMVLVYSLLILSLFFLFLLVVDMIPSTRKQVQVYRALRTVHWESLAESVFDAVLGLVSFITILIILLRLSNSSSNTKEALADLTSFDWTRAGSNQDFMGLKLDYMQRFNVVKDLFSREERYGIATTFLSTVLLIRVVMCCSAHPRIELITKTAEVALSDLAHFAALLLIIFSGFACLGNWLFGGERVEFKSFMSSFSFLFDSILGPPGVLPLGSASDTVGFIYAALFHSICFFFLLNFMLAIIVDAYTKVMEMVRKCVVDQNIVSDLVSVFQYQVLLHRYNFPLRRVVVSYLKRLDVDVVVKEDLYPSDLFPSEHVAEAYFRFYSKFSFLVDDVEEAETPTLDDLATIMALTMHKVELVQHQVDAIHDTNVASVPAHIRPTGRKTTGHTHNAPKVSEDKARW